MVGGVLLAAVTSLPNAVAAVYLARRGRGAAMLSTALNSNVLNVAFGLLLPSVVVGEARLSDVGRLVACWYGGLTALVLVFAFRDRGVRRSVGALVMAAYVLFVFALTLSSAAGHLDPLTAFGLPLVVVVVAAVLLARPPRVRGRSTAETAEATAA